MTKDNNTIFQGARLHLARTFNGLTLAELGDKVSASRQYMQRLEGDTTTSPSRDMLHALAEILSVESTFFFEPVAGQVREEECHFRKLRTTPQNVRVRALSYGTIFSHIVTYLEQHVKLPAVNIPSIKVSSREDIERAAETCRQHWGLRFDAPIVNVTRTLENFGCVVTTFEGVSEKIDAFSYVRSRPVIVRSVDKGSPSRSRFDLAHECGHIVMHGDIEVGDHELEDQANQFASAFLLPRAAFIREFPASNRFNWHEIINIKKRWGVSIQAIVRRAHDLGLISALQYRNAQVHFSRMGWRHGEPPETEPATEATEIIAAAFEILKEHHGMASAQVAHMLHMKCDILNKFNIACDDTASIPTQDLKRVNNVVSLNQHRQKMLN